MSQAQPNPNANTNVDNAYRRASASDPSRPSEWVRRKVIAHAAQLAAERSIKQNSSTRLPKLELPQPEVVERAPNKEFFPHSFIRHCWCGCGRRHWGWLALSDAPRADSR